MVWNANTFFMFSQQNFNTTRVKLAFGLNIIFKLECSVIFKTEFWAWLEPATRQSSIYRFTFQSEGITDFNNNPDSKVHGANMRPTWVLSAPDGPHVGPMNLAIRESIALAPMAYPGASYLHWIMLSLNDMMMSLWCKPINGKLWTSIPLYWSNIYKLLLAGLHTTYVNFYTMTLMSTITRFEVVSPVTKI